MAKQYDVIVGGWRVVGTYDTYEEAKEKLCTCVSADVRIKETEVKE
tara:strand:+ start:190 stop:327 length:138 start_codon:yes stop_codon:yes gene_type:complete